MNFNYEISCLHSSSSSFLNDFGRFKLFFNELAFISSIEFWYSIKYFLFLLQLIENMIKLKECCEVALRKQVKKVLTDMKKDCVILY